MKRITAWFICMAMIFVFPVTGGVAESSVTPQTPPTDFLLQGEEPLVTYQQEAMVEENQQPYGQTATPTFGVENAAGNGGDTVAVRVWINNNSGIISAKLRLAYDSAVLTPVSVEAGDFADVSFSPVMNNPLVINWIDALQPNNELNGTLATVTFTIKENAPIGESDLSITYNPNDVFDAALNNVAFAVQNGKVTVVDYLPGDLNQDGEVNNKDLSALLRYLNNWNIDFHKNAADVNGDGEINNLDFVLLQRFLNGWDVTLSYGNCPVLAVETLRVATYNIHYLSKVSGNAQTVSDFILRNKLDVVGIQEVDKNVGRDGPSQDQAKVLAEQLGWYYGYSKAISFGGGEYGHAILSKYPILSYQTVSLSSGAEEQRVMGHAVVEVGEVQVNLLNCHLSYQSMNQTQLNQIRAYVAALPSYVLMGDFFTTNFVNLGQIDGTMVNNYQTTFQTCPEDGAVDNIFVKHFGVSQGVMVENTYSDHHLLYADVNLHPQVQTVNGLRVGTYNIRHLADVSGDASVIANFILQNNLDVVGLQEVDNNVGRDGPKQNQVKAIAEALGWYWGFSKAISLSGGEYGHGIISKYPIEGFNTYSLQSADEEGRAMGHAVLNVAGKKVNFVNLHLSWQSMTGTQINQVAAHVKGYGNYIVVGDFNAEYDELTPIEGSLVNNATDRFVTNVEDGCIDNIIVNGYTVSKGTMVESNYSDHSMLYANVTF